MQQNIDSSALRRRGAMLLEQGRFDLAEREFRGALAQDPHDALSHAHLGMCLMENKKLEEALQEAGRAIGLAPDEAFGHYVAALVHDRMNSPGEAMRSAKQALTIEPDNPNYHTLIGQLLLDRHDWKGALDVAQLALELEPEHVSANNLRAVALTKLGRKQEAGATIANALRRNPENAVTHANMGWKLLHEGRAKEAGESFREALRLEPGNEWARQGLVTALKARNPVYGLFLRYALFMGRLKPQVAIALIVGVFLLPRLVNAVTAKSPTFKPYGHWLLIVYAALVVSTWLADPLFNLLLQLHPLGRHAVNTREKWQGTVLGLFILTTLGALTAWWLRHEDDLLTAALALIFAAMPTTRAITRTGAGGIIMWCFGGVATALALLGFGLILSGVPQGVMACNVAIICVAVSTWVSAGTALSRKLR